MSKLAGHWVAKRVGIVEHYKNMTLGEIVLFDVYLLLANKETWECWIQIDELVKIIPMCRRTIMYSKRHLLKRGWIRKIGKSGIWIAKLFRYDEHKEGSKVQNEPRKVQNEPRKVQNNTLVYKKKKRTYVGTSDEVRLSESLFSLILERDPKATKPNIQSWALHIDRLIRINKRDPVEIEKVIRWCQADNFWHSNIMSTAKLREKYTQLKSKMEAKQPDSQKQGGPPAHWLALPDIVK